jgi:hypothetical protein
MILDEQKNYSKSVPIRCMWMIFATSLKSWFYQRKPGEYSVAIWQLGTLTDPPDWSKQKF